MKRNIRENIQNMAGYVPGFQPKADGIIKLNTNENPFSPSPLVLRALTNEIGVTLKKYPDPLSQQLREKAAALNNVTPDEIIIGNGSDDILSIIMRSCLSPADRILLTDPTYTLYNVLAKVQDADIKIIPLNDDFSLSDSLTKERARLVFIPQPNAQTGTYFDKKILSSIAENCGGILVIDEAYVDFAKEDCLDLYAAYENIVITRSFSKSYALAGMRIGYGIARETLLEEFMKVKDSYNVSRLAVIAASAALDDQAYYTDCTEQILKERELLAENLLGMGLHVYPSQANFILVRSRTYPANKLYEELYKRKILVRYFDTPRLRECIRISIGTHEEMLTLLATVKEILSSAS